MKKLLFIIGFLQIMFVSQAQSPVAIDTTNNFCIGAEQWIYQFEDWSRPRIFDFDNDGDKDFAIIEDYADSLAVYINNGTADFTVTAAIKIPTSGNLVDLANYDFDADGFMDLVTLADNGDLYFYKNTSGITIGLTNTLSNTINTTLAAHKIEVHDLNNDGFVDIIGSGMDFSTNMFYAFTYQQTGIFTFAQMTLIPVFAGHNAQFNLPATHFAFADFDADGFQDFVIGSEDLTDTIEVYQNLGTTATIGYLGTPFTFTNAASGVTKYILARDCNGDGMQDISIASSAGFSINKNLATGMTFTPSMVDLSIFCQQFEYADVNSDNTKDLITSDYGNYNIYPGTSASQIQFSSGFYNNFNLFDRRQFALADLDANSIPDFLFVGTGDAPYLQVSRNFTFLVKNVIVSTNSVICGSTPVQFSVSCSDPTYPGIYNWTPGPATGLNYTATTSGPVSCAFSYTLPPNMGQCTLYSDTINVTSQAAPTAVINTSASGPVCAGTTVTLSASVVPASTTYTWNTGPTSAVIAVGPTVTTTYSLFMDNGCQTTATIAVNVNPNPTVSISAPSTTICQGDSLTLSGNGALNYQWSPTSSTSPSIIVTPSVSSTYVLVGANAFGCSDTAYAIIVVNTAPVLSVVPSKTLICFPDTVTLIASGAPSYTWSTNANTSTVSVLVFSNTNYTVSGSNGGCKATAIYSLTGYNRPLVTATSNSASVCLGDQVTLQAFGAASYTWAPPFFQFGSTVFDTPSGPTTYSVLGIGTNGCYNYTTVSVGVNNPPVLDILSTELCVGKPAEFTATGASSYTWNTGALSVSISQTPSNTSPITYTVDGIDATGCKSTVVKQFEISTQCSLIVWNGVTPNGDDHNDFFRIENIEQYPGNRVQIFNRWGQLIDDINDYNNASKKWDGTTNTNNPVPTGTYFYVIDLKNGSALLKGHIELTKKDLN